MLAVHCLWLAWPAMPCRAAMQGPSAACWSGIQTCMQVSLIGHRQPWLTGHRQPRASKQAYHLPRTRSLLSTTRHTWPLMGVREQCMDAG